MPRSLAVPRVQIAWATTMTGAFTVGTSTVGGSDVIVGHFGAAGVTFTDVTSATKHAQGQRGRSDTLGRAGEGTCTLTLKDTNGTYNPENAGSSLAGLLIPGRPVKVTDTHLGVSYGLFYGVIRSIESRPARHEQEAVIECVDLFNWLQLCFPIIAATGPTTVGTAIGLLLDAIGYDGGSARSLATGSTIPDFSADGTVPALALIEGLLAVDLGLFIVDGDGVATYQDRQGRYRAGTTAGALTGTVLSQIHPRVSLDQIRNRARVTRTGGVQQEASDATSQAKYGVRDHPPLTSDYLPTDSDAGALASFLVALQKNPRDPVQAIEVLNRDDTAIALQLGLELGDQVVVSESLGGTSFTGNVEGIQWDISGGGQFHKTQFLVSKRLMTFFVVDVSAVGSTTEVVGY